MHRAQRALRDMEKVRHEGDIEKYLLTLEYLNIDADMTGVAWHHMIEKRLPIAARRQWAHKKFDLDSQFIESDRNCTKAEESFKEQLGLEKSTEHQKIRNGENQRQIKAILLLRIPEPCPHGPRSAKIIPHKRKGVSREKSPSHKGQQLWGN